MVRSDLRTPYSPHGHLPKEIARRSKSIWQKSAKASKTARAKSSGDGDPRHGYSGDKQVTAEACFKCPTLKGGEAVRYVENTLGFPMAVLESFPKFFLIETINVCNARCVMCGIDFSKKQKTTMSGSLFDKIADELSQYSSHLEKVMLYLDGEPLLDRRIAARIRRMKQAGVRRVNVASNASLLNSERGVELIESGLDEIYITLDSLRKEIYESIRVGLRFETVLENILGFIDLRNSLNPNLMIRMQFIVQDRNRGEAVEFERYWAKLLAGNDQIAIQKAHNWASAVEVPAVGDEESVNAIPCIALWGTLAIHVTGEVGLCCMDSESKILLGNVEREPISEIWSGNRLRAIRDSHLRGERRGLPLCDGCTLWREAKRELKEIQPDS